MRGGGEKEAKPSVAFAHQFLFHVFRLTKTHIIEKTGEESLLQLSVSQTERVSQSLRGHADTVSDPEGLGRACQFAASTGELLLLLWHLSLRTPMSLISQKTTEVGKSEISLKLETQAKEAADSSH